jgi:hypothetical protein
MGPNVRNNGFTILLLPFALPCAPESNARTSRAAAHITFKVIEPSIFKVLQTTPVVRGSEYRVCRT